MRRRLSHFLSARGPKLVKDLASLASGQLFSMVIGFIAFAYLARVFDPETYGAVEFAIAIAAFFAMVIECGIGTIGVREIAKDHAKAPDLAAQVPAARLALALIVVPLVGLSSYASGQGETVTALVWLFALSLFAAPWRQDWLLQGLELMHQAAFAQAVRMSVFAVGAFLFVHGTGDILTVGWVEIAAVAAATLYFLVVQYVWAVPFRYRFSLAEPWRLIREGAAVGLSNVVWAFKLYAPMYLLVLLVGAADAAWLGASQRIALSILTMSFVYHFNLYPVIARTIEQNPESWQRVMESSFRLVAWSGIGLALVFTLLSRDIMVAVFGAPFAAGGPVLAILIWLFPLRTLTGHTRWALIASGRQRLLLISELLGAGAVLASGLALIPPYGAAGAAGALLTGIAVSGAATQYFAETFIGRLRVFKGACLPVSAALVCGIAATSLLENAFLGAALALAAYTACALPIWRTLIADLRILAYAKAHAPVGSGSHTTPEP